MARPRRQAVGRRRHAVGGVLVAAAAAGVPRVLAAAAAAAPGPGAGAWARGRAEDHGLDSRRVHAAAAHIFGSLDAAERDCLLLVKDGVLVYESYRGALYNDTAHSANSVTKTLGGLLAGWAASRGMLDIDADITAVYGVPSPRPYPVTTRQIMSQAIAGLHGPGEEWVYDAGGTMWLYALPEIFREATGRSPSDVWREEFARPLGLSESFAWDADASWATGSVGTCRDFARIGQLLLSEGRWAGVSDPIVGADYLNQMVTPQTRYGQFSNYSNPCYGLLTWLNTDPASDRGSARFPGVCHMWPQSCWLPRGSSRRAYLASGVMGQTVLVLPDKGLVVVSMGSTPDDNPVMRVLYEGVCMLYPGECPDFPEPAPLVV